MRSYLLIVGDGALDVPKMKSGKWDYSIFRIPHYLLPRRRQTREAARHILLCAVYHSPWQKSMVKTGEMKNIFSEILPIGSVLFSRRILAHAERVLFLLFFFSFIFSFSCSFFFFFFASFFFFVFLILFLFSFLSFSLFFKCDIIVTVTRDRNVTGT